MPQHTCLEVSSIPSETLILVSLIGLVLNSAGQWQDQTPLL